MKTPALLLSALVALAAPALKAADDYAPGPDSLPHPGVPKGELIECSFDHSQVFPGTRRKYWIYVPAQYKGDKPACVMVVQDGVRWNAPVVFDNLLARGEIPVLIGVFVEPGVVPAARPDALPRFNRSVEYDGLGDAYARFLLEELLPDVESKHAADGRPIRLSHEGKDRAIGGQSSGGVCSFTAAWERPEEFSRVFSGIGTFVGLRGGDVYPTLIRKSEPKPIRVFLQDGSNDHNHYGGDWWMAAQTMERALTFAGYEVAHAWGDGGHTTKQGTMVFPDALRWLWKGWPAPVGNGPTGNEMMNALLIPGEGWKPVAENLAGSDALAVNARGEVFFSEVRANKLWKIGLDGRRELFSAEATRVNGQAFGPDGRLYAVSIPAKTLWAYDAAGHPKALVEGLAGNDLAVAHNGNIYVTDPPPSSSNEPSKVWLVRPDGSRMAVDTGIHYANGITLSPDQSLLYVTDWRSRWVYSFEINGDGTLADKQRFYHLHEPDTDDKTSADGIRGDRDGRLYVCTNLGVQVCDQAGRVNCIIPTPNRHLSNLTFGGANFDVLYATCADKVYARKLKAVGANGWDLPNKPAPPKL